MLLVLPVGLIWLYQLSQVTVDTRIPPVYTRLYIYIYICVCVCLCTNINVHVHVHVFACIHNLFAGTHMVQSRVAAGFSRFSKNIPKPFLMYTHVHVHVCSVIETRQSKATTPEDKKSWIRTLNILRTRQTLYQLSQRGSSAGQAESLNVIQGQGISSLINRATHFSTVEYMNVECCVHLVPVFPGTAISTSTNTSLILNVYKHHLDSKSY